MRLPFFALAALLLPATAFAQDALPTGKLPDTVKPIAYRLDLTVLPKEQRFSGHTEIDVQLKKGATSIFMHGRDLKVSRAVVRIGKTEMPVKFTQLNPLGLAKLDFGKAMKPGKMTLKFDYDAPFGGGPSGLYHIKVADDWYSWSQFESIDARAAFPSFDEPGYKTPFTVSLTTTKGFVAASNAPEVGTTPAGALVKHRFAPTLPLPTYLVAFVVGPFETLSTVVPPTPQRAKPLPLRVIATKPNAAKMKYALDESGRIVSLLEKYFNQSFPYPKLDQIASPVMPGAMENAGADIYGDGILMIPDDATTASRQLFGMVVAHELSHQWFGDLATPAWWDDIWLNESFANWMGYRIGNEWRPELNIGTGAIDEAFTAMNIDALTAGRPIHEHIANDGAINAAFDQITYGKGGQVVAMIAAYMGDAKFRDGVRLHMKRHTYGNATTDEFFDALATAADDPRVLAALRSFVDQQGVPVVTLHREGGQLIGTQSRYAYFGADAKPEQWIIPFCIRQDAAKTCTLIDKPSVPVATSGNGVIVPNAGGQGYYRFDMDAADWDRLIATSGTLPGGEALAVDDSLWASFYAGKAKVGQLFAAASAMVANKDSNAAVDGGQRLGGLIRRGLVSAEALPAFRKRLDVIYAPRLAQLGFDPSANPDPKEDPDTQKLRQALVRVLADTARNGEVRGKLIAVADRWLAGDDKAIGSGYRSVAMRALLSERGVTYAEKLLKDSLAGKNDDRREAILDAIGDSGVPEIANWFIGFSDPKLDARSRYGAIMSMLNNDDTASVAADYVLANFASVASGRGGIFAARAAGSFGTLCTAAQADAVDAKLRPLLTAAHSSTLSLDRAVEQIRNCVKLRDAKAGEVSAGIMAQ